MRAGAMSLAVAERHGDTWTATLPSGLRTQAPSLPELVQRLDDLGSLPEASPTYVPSDVVALPVRLVRRPRPTRGGALGEALLLTGSEVLGILQQLRFELLARSDLHAVVARMRGLTPIAVPTDGYLAPPVLEAVVTQSGADLDLFRALR